MKHCFLVLLLLCAVSGCNFSDCFNAEDINTETIEENVPMKPERFDFKDDTTLWYGSNYVVKDNEITITIDSIGATLCKDNVIFLDKNGDIKNISISATDKLEFDILDAYENKITDAICEGKDPKFYTANPDECKNGKKDVNGNVITLPLKGSAYGAKFIADINSKNVVFNPAYEPKIRSFFNSVEDVPLFSTESSNIMGQVANGSFDYIDSGLKLANGDKKFDYICQNLNKPKIFSSIAKKISLENLAKACQMVCGAPIGKDEIVKSDCFHVVNVEENKKYKQASDGDTDMQQYVSFLKGARIFLKLYASYKYITDTNDYGIPDALILNHAYDLKSVLQQNSPNKNDTIQRLGVAYSVLPPLRGDYKISVKRACDASTEKSLYYYVGNSVPNLRPGESGTTNIPLNITENNKYTIGDGVKGNVYFGIKDNGDGYENNAGYFKIQARIPIKTPDILSSIVRDVRDSVLRVFYGSKFGYEGGKPMINQDDVQGAVGTIFKAIIGSTLLNIVKVLIVLYIAIFGISVLIGLVRTPHIDFLIIVLKISVVLTVFSENGWKFLSDNLFYWFIYGTSDLITAFSGDFSGGVDFSFIDASLGRFYKYQTWFQIISLLLAGPVGWLVMFIILFGIFAFFSAMFRAIVTYIISMTLVALLLSISPIFITLVFFKKTKAIFDAWIKNLAQIAIQPVFIMCTIAFLAQVMNGIMYGLFSYGVCTGCIMSFKMGNLDPICILNFLLPYGFNPLNPVGEHIRNTYNGYSFLGIPISIANVIAFAVLAHSIEKFTEQASTMVTSIFGAFGADISDPADKFVQSMKSVIGKDDMSQQHKAHQQHQKKRNKVE